MSETAWLKRYFNNLDFVHLGAKVLSFCLSSLPYSTFDEIKIEISFELSIFKHQCLDTFA